MSIGYETQSSKAEIASLITWKHKTNMRGPLDEADFSYLLFHRIFVKKLNGRDHLVELGIDRRIIWKPMF